jgi:hypothetical protein
MTAPDSFAWADEPGTLIGECGWCGNPIPVRAKGSTGLCEPCLARHFPEPASASSTASIVAAFLLLGLGLFVPACQALRAAGIAE